LLSGGIDSSLITAIMQKISSRPVKTFTIGFEDKKYNEAVFAKEVARHLGTEHHEVYFTGDMVKGIVPQLPSIYSEPFADRSQLPTFLLTQATKQHVTVALSGDAGDELFGGYRRYFATTELWAKQQKLNQTQRTIRHSALKIGSLFDRSKKEALQLLECRDLNSFYHKKMSKWWPRADIVLGGQALTIPGWQPDPQALKLDDFHQLMLLDQKTYLSE